MISYPWYEIVDADEVLMQGDFICSCPVIVASSSIGYGKISADIFEYDVIIMSQSCDIAHKKLNNILVSPIWPISDVELKYDFLKSRRGKEALRQGNLPGYHLINRCELDGFEADFQVVDFRNVYSVPLDFLVDLSKRNGKRLRLMPPYREHLSQAFARFFMRIGLPVDIDLFHE
ncbi:MAG TPA: hypothetical protein PKK11_07140 [Methanothrix sp.]|nr:hypothetical protein [Methanothrix sp.]HPT20124.1 hypothetical protein [Methanothrix sp.]